MEHLKNLNLILILVKSQETLVLTPSKENKAQAARILKGAVAFLSKWKMSLEERSVM